MIWYKCNANYRTDCETRKTMASTRNETLDVFSTWARKLQGSKGQEGELFGIQNLLKFSDDSLLKALRMKHEAALAAAGAGGGAGGSKGGGSGGGLGVAGVDTANEAELMVAMKVALDRRIKGEVEEGEPRAARRWDLLSESCMPH